MDLTDYSNAVERLTLFPEEVRNHALTVGIKLSPEKRQELFESLQEIYADLTKVHQAQVSHFEDAAKAIDTLKREKIPVLREEIEEEENNEALKVLSIELSSP
jgi:vacuolar-type H+-ATPase subunit D/Vma8